MEIRFITILLINFCLLSVVVSLKCRCDEVKCIDKTEKDCPVGIVNDPCNCCTVCAKNVGELCGGIFGGQCAEGLKCVEGPIPSDYEFFVPNVDAIGICHKNE